MDNSNTNTKNNDTIPIALRSFEESEFLHALDAIAQWALSYIKSLQDREVSPAVAPGDILAKLPDTPPVKGEGNNPWTTIVRDLETIIEPGLVHWQSPRFFAYFPCSASMPGIMGEFVSSIFNVNGMLWATSPSATELEMRMMDWSAELFGLPDQFRFDGKNSIGGGCIQGTASEAVLAALLAGRKKQVKRGRDRSTMTVYTSSQAHSSVIKAAMVAGLADTPEDRSRVRLIPVDQSLAMDAKALSQAIDQDIKAGLTPCLVSTTQGTTSTGAMDPLAAIGRDLKTFPDAKRPWLHVDAAWAGAAAVCPEHRYVLDGIKHADSLCINPHKWLLTNFDCDLFWVKDRQALTDSMNITPAYLHDRQSESGEVIDYRNWHVPLGRKMRAIKLWFVIRYFGIDGLRRHIRDHIDLAKVFEKFVISEPRLELATKRSLGLVCFSVMGDNTKTKKLIEQINERKRVMLSHTVVPIANNNGIAQDQWIVRVAIGSTGVAPKDINELINEVHAALNEVIQ